VAFLVVTSPAQEALEEAAYFEHRTRDELDLPLSGYVLNRSLADAVDFPMPNEVFLAETDLSAHARDALLDLARGEHASALADRELLERLQQRLGDGCFAASAPYLHEGVSDLPTLSKLCDELVGFDPV
jgi:hypothetical protein